jgi:hypothetical protein
LKDIFQILRALGTRYFLCVEFSDFYVNQSLAGQTIETLHYNIFEKLTKLWRFAVLVFHEFDSTSLCHPMYRAIENKKNREGRD